MSQDAAEQQRQVQAHAIGFRLAHHLERMPPVSDEEWTELAQDLPAIDDPFIQNYLKGRQALIDEEKRQRSDHAFRQSLSPIARRACAIVDRIRDEEMRTVWTPDVEERLAQAAGAGVTVWPGMMFTLAKDLMETTQLWRVVRRMPKGCLLHAHCDAMVDFDFVLATVLATPGIHIAAGAPLTSDEARREARIDIRFRASTSGSDDAGSIWRADYRPNTPVLLADAADAFPYGGGGGGRTAFLAWLKSRCVISQTDAVEQQHGVAEIWRKFAKCFDIIGSMIHYEPVWRAFLRRLMSLLVADGVYWTEIRFACQLNYCREGCETPEPDYDHMYQVIDEEVTRFRATEEGARFWGIRMIWTTLRGLPTQAVIQDMNNCITTKLAWPHLLAGYDVVGPEEAGRPLKDLLPELFWFRKQCADEGITIPFFFHAGECLGDGDTTDENLFDAVTLGTRRIGHGFSLHKHPLLVQAVRERRILVESCPISNEVLRLCSSVLAHPLPSLLARGVACSLNNDDPAILGQDTAGMTHDFWQALQGWHNLGLAGLGALAENSVRWAAFEDQTADEWQRDLRAASLGAGVKAERLKQWAVEWEQFCLWVVTEFGDEDEEDEKNEKNEKAAEEAAEEAESREREAGRDRDGGEGKETQNQADLNTRN